MFNEGKKQAVLQFLPVLDNLERSIASLHENADLDAYLQGIELIVKLFREALRRLDVEEIITSSQRFDPYLHEAFEIVERDDEEDWMVIGEVERGYMMGEKVIRPAKVKVAVKPPQQLAPPKSLETESGSENTQEF